MIRFNDKEFHSQAKPVKKLYSLETLANSLNTKSYEALSYTHIYIYIYTYPHTLAHTYTDKYSNY